MLAYIQSTSKIIENEYGCKYFTQYRSKEFIDVRCIDHCIGFAKIDNRYYTRERFRKPLLSPEHCHTKSVVRYGKK